MLHDVNAVVDTLCCFFPGINSHIQIVLNAQRQRFCTVLSVMEDLCTADTGMTRQAVLVDTYEPSVSESVDDLHTLFRVGYLLLPQRSGRIVT